MTMKSQEGRPEHEPAHDHDPESMSGATESAIGYGPAVDRLGNRIPGGPWREPRTEFGRRLAETMGPTPEERAEYREFITRLLREVHGDDIPGGPPA